MDTLSAVGIHMTSPAEVYPHTYDYLRDFSYTFEFGKSYLLNAKLGRGGWALSYIMGGLIEPEIGEIHLNDTAITAEDLQKLSWQVPFQSVKRWGYFQQSVKSQIQQGLREHQHIQFAKAEILEIFKLTPERYTRKLSQLSSERWRASCAIGFVHNKKIFCFPDCDYVRTGFYAEYKALWLKQVIDFLAEQGYLILVPHQHDRETDGLCDVVVSGIDTYYRDDYITSAN